jgi:hypothetical protein
MIPMMYSMPPTNGRDTVRWSQTGTVPDFSQFTGTVDYGSFNQGYDTVLTPVEFTRGIQAERKLLDDDQFNILDARPKGLAASAFRTRQLHGAGALNGAFSTSNPFYVNSSRGGRPQRGLLDEQSVLRELRGGVAVQQLAHDHLWGIHGERVRQPRDGIASSHGGCCGTHRDGWLPGRSGGTAQRHPR